MGDSVCKSSPVLKPISPKFALRFESDLGLIRLGAETGRSEQEIILHDLRVRCRARAAPCKRSSDASRSDGEYVSVIQQLFHYGNAEGGQSMRTKHRGRLKGGVTKLAYSQRLADSNCRYKLQQCFSSPAAGFSGELDTEFKARSERGATFLSRQDNHRATAGCFTHKCPIHWTRSPVKSFVQMAKMQMRNVRACKRPERRSHLTAI